MNTIQTPDDPALEALVGQLAQHAEEAAASPWPEAQLRRCAQAGVMGWFVPEVHGGLGWSAAWLARGWLALGSACLTTAFILTQRAAACRRLSAGANLALASALLPALASGERDATVGLSHLTTSRRHLGRPAMLATRAADGGLVLDGALPWVTGAGRVGWIVAGATDDRGAVALVALDAATPGVEPRTPDALVAIQAGHTAAVDCRGVHIPPSRIIADLAMDTEGSVGPGAGGLQTSALALGHARAPLAWLDGQAHLRSPLAPPAEALRQKQRLLEARLLALAEGTGDLGDSPHRLRAEANLHVMRVTQAAMVAARGAGMVEGHPVGRWCREALFFMVWSNPDPIPGDLLRNLSGQG